MKKVTVTIEEDQDGAIRDIQVSYAKKRIIKNYSKVLREVIDEGLKKF